MPEGAEPADLPIEQTTEFPLVLNPRTANVLTFGLPKALLMSGDEVIE